MVIVYQFAKVKQSCCVYRIILEWRINVFSGFNLKLDGKFIAEAFGGDFNKYKKPGEEHLKSEIVRLNIEIKDLINLKTINGSQLQEYCFPSIGANIFISHSHKDRDLANALAGWINKSFGLKVFVDSNVWEYSSEILDEINSQYSNMRPNGRNGCLYDHKSCCKASEHVNTMLSVALHKMIDNVECVILLNTDNSVQVFEDKKFDSTYSPWIYSEIMCTQIVRKKPLLCYREYNELMHFNESTGMTHDEANLVVSYIISLKHLMPIGFDHLINWQKNIMIPNFLKIIHWMHCIIQPMQIMWKLQKKYIAQ